MMYVHYDSRKGCDRLVQDIREEKTCAGLSRLYVCIDLITLNPQLQTWRNEQLQG